MTASSIFSRSLTDWARICGGPAGQGWIPFAGSPYRHNPHREVGLVGERELRVALIPEKLPPVR